MRKSKEQKAITLIALIITIVVLLILAAVAISSIQENGILGYAQNAADSWNKAAQNEANMLGDYLNYLNNMGSGNGGGDIDVTDDATMSAKTTNTKIEDIYGNKITIPAGFKISVENTGYTKDTLDVTKGIVIEDVTKDASGNPTSTTGNQFVWIPCGTINHLDENGEETTSTITLGRYGNFKATNGVYTPATYIEDIYTEDTEAIHEEGCDNAIARNIEDFKTSATQNKGYYIGRYEAGNSNNTLVCKTGQTVYVNITQPDASDACKGMYPDGYKSDGTGTFSSDLINSYAWDTAIIFIQTFGGEAASYYCEQNASEEIGEFKTTTGTTGDEYCNINDMSGNAREWTTETSGRVGNPCVFRGGYCDEFGYSGYYTSIRDYLGPTNSSSDLAFRPLIYVGL